MLCERSYSSLVFPNANTVAASSRTISCHAIFHIMHGSPCSEEINAKESSRTCAYVCRSDCSKLFGIARAIQDLNFQNTKSLLLNHFKYPI